MLGFAGPCTTDAIIISGESELNQERYSSLKTTYVPKVPLLTAIIDEQIT